jgi:hypothetical protein
VAMCAGRPDHLDVDEDVRELLLACFAGPSARPSPDELARGLTNLARGNRLDVEHGDFGRGLMPWRVPAELGITPSEAASEPSTAGTDPPLPQPVDDVVGRFIVLPASLGWNPLVGLDDEVSTALRASCIQGSRRTDELRWSWRGYEFVLPLVGSLSAPNPGETLWTWLDHQTSRFAIAASKADIGGRIIHTSSPADELFVSLNPDVSPERPHFVVLETDDDAPQRDRPEELSYSRRSGNGIPWDETEEERLSAEFLRGVPIQRLAESHGRSVRALCHRLEVLGVVERLRS